MERFDAIVVGAGPAGSLTAYRLASAGASVLLVDRARFPRDKPCGGGLTLRAVRWLPFRVDPVVEDVVDRVTLRLRYGASHERESGKPLLLMTRRSRLDAFLAERAVAAGADFRDGVRVGALSQENGRVTAEIDGRAVEARALVGADGANGTAARTFGLCPKPLHGVALEGTLPYEHVDAERYRRRAVFELGNVVGGYGWVFPKADHVNVGVGGYAADAPRLREHLARLCRAHGFPEQRLRDVRGHRLPISRAHAPLAHGRALVVGDAAGLVDPLSGDGLYEAFMSTAFAAEATLDLLAGRAGDLGAYDARITAALRGERRLSWGAKSALDRFPRLVFAVAGTELVQSALERLVRGEPPSPRALPRLLRRLLVTAA